MSSCPTGQGHTLAGALHEADALCAPCAGPQALLLQPDVELVMQHTLGTLRSVLQVSASGRSIGNGSGSGSGRSNAAGPAAATAAAVQGGNKRPRAAPLEPLPLAGHSRGGGDGPPTAHVQAQQVGIMLACEPACMQRMSARVVCSCGGRCVSAGGA